MARRMPASLSGQVGGAELVLDRDHAAADVHADHARNDGGRRQASEEERSAGHGLAGGAPA